MAGTVADAPASTHPHDPHPSEQIVDDLLPIAAQIVGCVHDHEPAATQRLLATVAPERLPQLVVVLAALVPADRSISQLLAWTDQPPPSLDGTEYDVEPGQQPWGNPQVAWNARLTPCPLCGEQVQNRHMSRHRRRRHAHEDTGATMQVA